MTAVGTNEPVPIPEAAGVLVDIAQKKLLEINQRKLDDPELRGGIFDLAIEVLSQVGEFAKLSEQAVEERAAANPQLEHSLRPRIFQLSSEVGLIGYHERDLTNLLGGICTECIAVLEYIIGFYASSGATFGVDYPFTTYGALGKARQGFSDSLKSIELFALKHTLAESVHAATEAADEAKEAAVATKEAAGTVADATLGSYYGGVAGEEASSAKYFRLGAIACLVVGVGIAAWIASVIITNHEEGVASQLFKLAACLPVLGVAFYLSHESTSHRMVARRAKEVEVRLQTMEAFLAPLEPDQKTLLRAKVGESILSGPLSLSAGTDKETVDLQKVIEKLIDKA